jgi:NAD(P)-dependent dehydrogenase (short-subunit alcohol dehydrogenase family)
MTVNNKTGQSAGDNGAAQATRSLAGKVALVTGGSRGIGSAICYRLGAMGALVTVVYRSDRKAAEATVAGIRELGGDAFALPAEMAALTSIDDMLTRLDEELLSRTGAARFDILVNNAGVAPNGTVEQTTEATFDEVIGVNLKGPFFLTQKSIPRLRDGGRVINISSTAAIRGRPYLAIYGPSKAALNLLTLALSNHLGPRGITVNAIAPGAVETDINAAYLAANPNAYADFAKNLALGRVGQPRDLASIVGFIASDEASWITGQVIYVDGGSSFN